MIRLSTRCAFASAACRAEVVSDADGFMARESKPSPSLKPSLATSSVTVTHGYAMPCSLRTDLDDANHVRMQSAEVLVVSLLVEGKAVLIIRIHRLRGENMIGGA